MTITKEQLDYLKTPSLVKYVQEMHLELETAIKEKRDKVKRYKEMKQMINSLRYILIDRLRQMNRYDPIFFPIKSYVEYQNNGPDGNIIVKTGKVVGHEGGFVWVQFKDEEHQTKVDPACLSLLFIRNKYY